MFTATRSEVSLEVSLRIACGGAQADCLSHAINIGRPVDRRETPEELRAAVPQLRQWWLDEVAAYYAKKEMEARGGRARGRPGSRPT